MMRAVSRYRCALIPIGAGPPEHRLRALRYRDQLDARRGRAVLSDVELQTVRSATQLCSW
jgi:hypothetical protein